MFNDKSVSTKLCLTNMSNLFSSILTSLSHSVHLQSSHLTDLVLLCTGPQGLLPVAVHSAVLSSQSSLLRNILLSTTEPFLVLPEVEAITVWRMLDLVYTGRCLVTKLDKLKLVQLLTSLGMESVVNAIEMKLLAEEHGTISASPKSMINLPRSVFKCEERQDVEVHFHQEGCNKNSASFEKQLMISEVGDCPVESEKYMKRSGTGSLDWQCVVSDVVGARGYSDEVHNCFKTDPVIDKLKIEIVCGNQTLLLDLEEEFSFEDIVKFPVECLEGPYSQPGLEIKKTRRSSKKGGSACDSCERVFSCKSLLRKHVKTAHIKPEDRAACAICCKVFRAQHLVQQHVREVHSSVTFSCEVCIKTFGSKCSLKRHLETHTKEKCYHCHLCDKSFTTSKYLSHHHIAVHKLEDTICSVCGKMYKNKYQMHKHFNQYHVN